VCCSLPAAGLVATAVSCGRRWQCCTGCTYVELFIITSPHVDPVLLPHCGSRGLWQAHDAYCAPFEHCYVVCASAVCRPGGDSRELWQALAVLYKGQGRPDLSLAVYLQLQLPSVFDFIKVGDMHARLSVLGGLHYLYAGH
jgi:hypothetical protein